MMYFFIAIIWGHFIGDFILQSDKMALNKSKSNFYLFYHVTVYMMPFMICSAWIDTRVLIPWLVSNFILHFITDYISSRTASYYWNNNKRHQFFVTIGFDQAVHITCLVVTYVVFINDKIQISCLT